MDYEKKYKESVEKLRYKISDENGNIDYKAITGRNKELIDWLKSLKQRMEEQ